jgi:hypothetical protein
MRSPDGSVRPGALPTEVAIPVSVPAGRIPNSIPNALASRVLAGKQLGHGAAFDALVGALSRDSTASGLAAPIVARQQAPAPAANPQTEDLNPYGSAEARKRVQEIFGPPGQGIGARALANNIKKYFLDTNVAERHGWAADVMEGYWIRDVFDATLEMTAGELAKLQAVSSTIGRRARVGMAVERRLNPAFNVDTYLAAHPREFADPGLQAAVRAQFIEVRDNAAAEAQAVSWMTVLRDRTATQQEKEAATERVRAARAAAPTPSRVLKADPRPGTSITGGLEVHLAAPAFVEQAAPAGGENIDARMARIAANEVGKHEGDLGAVNAYDTQGISIHGGFGLATGGGNAPLKRLIADFPGMKQRLLATGFGVENDDWIALEVPRAGVGTVKTGAAALTALQNDVGALATIAAELTAPRQAEAASRAIAQETATGYSILPNREQTTLDAYARWSDSAIGFGIHTRLFGSSVSAASIFGTGGDATRLVRLAQRLAPTRTLTSPRGRDVVIREMEASRLLAWGSGLARTVLPEVPADAASAVRSMLAHEAAVKQHDAQVRKVSKDNAAHPDRPPKPEPAAPAALSLTQAQEDALAALPAVGVYIDGHAVRQAPA